MDWLTVSLIATRRLLFILALLIGLIFSLGSFLPAQMTNLNLTCGDSIGLIQAINQANVNNQAVLSPLTPITRPRASTP